MTEGVAVKGQVRLGAHTGSVWAVPAAARPMADSAAVLYALGGLLVLGSMPIGGTLTQRWPLGLVAAVAIGTGTLLHFHGERLPLIGYQALTAFAAVLITFAIYVGGSTAFAYAFFYVWVAAWAFYFLSPRAAWLEMAWMAAVSGLQMLRAVPGGHAEGLVPVVLWATMVITACSTGLLLVYLVERRERDRDQLSWHRQQLTDVMAGLPLSIFALDTAGQVVLVEGSALNRFPSTEGILERSIFDLLPEGHELRAAATRALEGEEVFGAVEIGDGEFEYRMTPMLDDRGALLRVSGTLVDVTEPRRLAREAGEKKARELFLAKISHELRTPLNAMLGYLQLLDSAATGFTPRQRIFLENASRAGRLQLELINDLLDLQKLRAAEAPFEIERVRVALLIEETVDVVRPLAEKGGIRLRVEPALGELSTDRRRVRQALLNLLSNAIKFSPAGSEVEIRVRRSPGRLAIEVADEGPGLAAADLERVFDEFYQVGPAKKVEGTGLGLSITRQIVRRLGGEVEVRSQLGEGATFRLVLPAGPVAVAEARPAV